jgi:hypothetical protein
MFLRSRSSDSNGYCICVVQLECLAPAPPKAQVQRDGGRLIVEAGGAPASRFWQVPCGRSSEALSEEEEFF